MTAAPVTEKPQRAKKLVQPAEPVEIDMGEDVRWGVFEITPDVARYWLTFNTNNPRHPIPRTIGEYARDIRNNAWLLNFQPITFRKDGSLDNGQNRLEAIVEADKPILSLVVWGVDPEASSTVDIGQKRTATQIIGATNPRYAAHMASAAALIWRLEYPNPQRALLDNGIRPTMHDRLDVLDRHKNLFDSIEYVMAKCGSLMKFAGSTATAHVFHYFGAQNHGKVATNRFFQLVNTGLAAEGEPPLTAKHPAYRLRETLQKIRREQQRIRQPYIYALWLPAWTAYINGDLMPRLNPVDYTQNPDLTIP
jgi:hypothetical protein